MPSASRFGQFLNIIVRKQILGFQLTWLETVQWMI